jgi:hypothetical protein
LNQAGWGDVGEGLPKPVGDFDIHRSGLKRGKELDQENHLSYIGAAVTHCYSPKK